MLVCNCTLSGDACLKCPNFARETMFESILEFNDKFISEQKDIDIEIQEEVNKIFWDLI